MKNTFLGLSLCLLQVLPFTVRAEDIALPVTYAEITFGCNGTTADTTVTPGLNVADKNVEVRVQGLGSATLSLNGNQVVLNTSDGQQLTLGTLTSAPTCQVEDTGDAPTASWNPIRLSTNVIMDLSQSGQENTLSVTDKQTQKEYQFSWSDSL